MDTSVLMISLLAGAIANISTCMAPADLNAEIAELVVARSLQTVEKKAPDGTVKETVWQISDGRRAVTVEGPAKACMALLDGNNAVRQRRDVALVEQSYLTVPVTTRAKLHKGEPGAGERYGNATEYRCLVGKAYRAMSTEEMATIDRSKVPCVAN